MPVSISELAGGGGAHILGTFSPLSVPCSLGPDPHHACSLERLGAALPAAPLQPGAWRRCLSGFHLSLVFFLSLHPSLPAMALSWHHPLPLPVGANLTSNPATVGSPSLLCRLGLGPKMGVLEVWACGHQGLAGYLSACLAWACSLSQLADLPLHLASRWAGLGFGKSRDSFLSETPLSLVLAPGRSEDRGGCDLYARCQQAKGSLHRCCAHTRPLKFLLELLGFLVSLSRAWSWDGADQAWYWGLVPPRGTRDLGGTGLLPPSPKPAARVSLH